MQLIHIGHRVNVFWMSIIIFFGLENNFQLCISYNQEKQFENIGLSSVMTVYLTMTIQN